jgi:hypothetical protein
MESVADIIDWFGGFCIKKNQNSRLSKLETTSQAEVYRYLKEKTIFRS